MRTRIISPRVEPPKDRAVFWMSEQGPFEQGQVAIERPEWATHWCTLPSIDGTQSGPVHSLEAQELPEDSVDIDIRIRGRWFEGFYDAPKKQWFVHKPCGGVEERHPDAWRPLDEPGDAELLDAARAHLEDERRRNRDTSPSFHALAELVARRSGK